MTDWKRLFAYDAWANRQALASLSVAGAPPEKARKWLGHLVGAGRLWLARLEGTPGPPPAVWPDIPLDEASAAVEDLARHWSRFVSELDESGGSRTVTYTNSKGEPWSTPVGEILMHVVLHGGYHRGQIASELRAAGFPPAYTDYIEAVRRGWV